MIPNEVKLWASMLKGDKNALESIYRSNVRDLFDYGNRISHDHITTEDCIQDLFIEIWTKRNRLNETQNVKAYLMLSLRRRIYRKQTVSKKHIDINERSPEFPFEPDLESLILDEESNKETHIKLKRAMEALTDQQKEILYLKFECNMKSKEIADMMEMKDQSVRNAIHRTINKLREKLILGLLMSTFPLLPYYMFK